MDDIKWGMIGCGAVTIRKSAPAYLKATDSTISGVFSRNFSKTEAYCKKNGIPIVFDSADSLINSPDIDAIYIATPPSSHFHYAMKVAAAKKPCCVEKPISNKLSDATKMVEAFKDSNVPLFVSYYRRSLPRFIKVKELITHDEIGDLRHIHWELARPPHPNDIAGNTGWRTEKSEAISGYFDDLACHGLDLFDWLLGPITKASGIQANQQKLYKAHDAISGCWLHESGVTGSGYWNFGSFKRMDNVSIVGTKGILSFSIFDEQAIKIDSHNSFEISIPNPDPIQLPHVENILKTLKSGYVHPSMGFSALRTAEVMAHITQS